jgi:hypothetical protein
VSDFGVDDVNLIYSIILPVTRSISCRIME